MTRKSKSNITMLAAAIVLMLGTAAAASYITKNHVTAEQSVSKQPVKRTATKAGTQQVASAAPVQQQRCDDGNILGMAAGGIAGGVVGHQIGNGKGNTAATIGGTIGGAYLGKEYIPLNGATCR